METVRQFCRRNEFFLFPLDAEFAGHLYVGESIYSDGEMDVWKLLDDGGYETGSCLLDGPQGTDVIREEDLEDYLPR